ncbi:MAG: EFR1 family ferrodoxin [Candidatus Cloacimonetes bacterium]|nr:EFR1 family ferrodoxin [Candidatus Cloacimonadota bacterium]MCF7867238.1 EFR1 family ferrodoxin [Candidatus Cloacimonadota bacterium]MCF7882682.1 EFR1 family ferrodoxin [Candidatus Cloacimonadota bacterium]
MNRIYFFTGSGNSLAIAKRVAEKLDNCELIKVTSKLDFSKPVEAEMLGFVFPVYAWGIPVLFKEFLSKIDITKVDYVFAITNFAGSSGNTLGLVQKILKKKNIKIDAFGEVPMPSNYVAMGNASSEHKARNILQKAEPVIEELSHNIEDRKQIPLSKKKLSAKLLTATVYPLFSRNIRKSDKTFFSTDKCIGCGICVLVCPAENIILNEDKGPVWQHRCEQCHACIHWCPERAIEFNKNTFKKKRYTHPDIKLKDMLID